MMCLVLKGFRGNGEELVPGQLIDTSDFRNREKLIVARFMRQATSAEIASAVEVPEGRSEERMKLRRKKRAA